MISSESIITNSTLENVFILSYYDGIKEEVDIKNKTIYLWYDYAADIEGEYWLKVEDNTEHSLFDYLSNKIGIKDLIDNSNIFLCTRLYIKYFEIKNKTKLENFHDINLPENIYLGYDFLSELKKNNLRKITYTTSNVELFEEINSDFSQHIAKGIKTIKIINANEVPDDYFYPIAA